MYSLKSGERLVDGNEGLAYKMDRNQMNLDRPWGKDFFLIFLNFFFF